MCIIDIEKYNNIGFLGKNLVDIGVMITDNQGNIEYINKFLEEKLGYKKEEVIGKKPSIYKTNAHKKEFYENLWSTILRGEIFKGHIINKAKDGSVVHFNSTIYPLINSATNNEIEGFMAIFYDITYYSNIEDKYLNLLNSLPDTTIIILDKNKQLLEIFPITDEELFNKLISKNNLEKHLELLNKIDENDKLKYNIEYSIDYEGEYHVYNCTYSRFNLEKYIIVASEITNNRIQQLQKIFDNNIEKLKRLYE